MEVIFKLVVGASSVVIFKLGEVEPFIMLEVLVVEVPFHLNEVEEVGEEEVVEEEEEVEEVEEEVVVLFLLEVEVVSPDLLGDFKVLVTRLIVIQV